MATEISFYHLQRQSLEQVLPRLLEKVLAAGLRAVVYTGSAERSESLDQWLWTYDPDSFLPHGTEKTGFPGAQPVYLTDKPENPNDAQVLVHFEEAGRDFIDGFDRCLDLFDGNDAESLEAARNRWKAYKQDGYAVTYWQQTEAGGWEQAG